MNGDNVSGMNEVVSIIDGGTFCADIALLMTERGYHTRVLCKKMSRMFSMVSETGCDMTRVSITEGSANNPETVKQLITSQVSIVVYVGSRAATSEYCNQLSSIVDAATAAGSIRQIILMSAVGTSRPWNCSTLFVNSNNLSLGWQRRGEDIVRACGIDYTIIKTGLVSPNQKSGWKGILVRQGDTFGAVSMMKPGLHSSAAAAVICASTQLSERKVTLEVVGDSSQQECSDPDFDWDSCFGVLLDDAAWDPPDLVCSC